MHLNSRCYSTFNLLLFVIFTVHTIYGYSKANFLFPEMLFNDITLQETNKDSALQLIKYSKNFMRYCGSTDTYNDSNNHFYKTDLNNHFRQLLVYNGNACAEGNWTVIWNLKGSKYQFIGELYGSIIGQFKKGSDTIYISTLAPGCCGSDCDYANLYVMINDTVVYLKSIAIFNGVKIPDSIAIRKNIIIKNKGYSLRSEPIINDKPDSMDIDRYGVLRGNTIVELNSGIHASATSSLIDSTGRTWWFLILDNPLSLKYNVYKGYNKNKRQICGWISTKYLEYNELK